MACRSSSDKGDGCFRRLTTKSLHHFAIAVGSPLPGFWHCWETLFVHPVASDRRRKSKWHETIRIPTLAAHSFDKLTSAKQNGYRTWQWTYLSHAPPSTGPGIHLILVVAHDWHAEFLGCRLRFTPCSLLVWLVISLAGGAGSAA